MNKQCLAPIWFDDGDVTMSTPCSAFNTNYNYFHVLFLALKPDFIVKIDEK